MVLRYETIQPRQALMTPFDSKGNQLYPLDGLRLNGSRTTHVNPVDGSKPYKIDDLFSLPGAVPVKNEHRLLPPKWTGYTDFHLQPLSQDPETDTTSNDVHFSPPEDAT